MTKNQKILLILIILLSTVLRFYKLDVNPPGLYWDEAAFGYDAFSILETGKDQHNVNLPIFFESFGDWKLPGYFYLLVPSIKIFGLSEFAIRFPSAFLGTISVLVFFYLIKRLTSNVNLSLFVSLMLGISPWHIQFSRGGFESTAGLFFVILGVYLFLVGINKKNSITLAFSFLLFTITMYTYHAYRIFTPLLLLTLFVNYKDQILKNLPKFIPPILISIAIALPILNFSFTSQGQSRAVSQSAFNKSSLEQTRIEYDQKSKKPLRFLSKYLYKRPVYFTYIGINGYLDHFSPVFLFIKGDQIGRHSQVDMGQIYLFEAIFLASSIFALKQQNNKTKKLMFSWLLLSPIPAIIVTPTPHAYRTLQMAPALAFFSGLGAYYVFSKIKFKFIKIIIVLFIIFWIISYLHLLFTHYPKKFSADWQDGYKGMVQSIKKYQDDFDKVYITNINQVPYIYLLFYQKYDPGKFINENGTRNGFDKYVFTSDDFNLYDKGRILYVAPSWKKVDGKWLDAVNDTAGRHIYSLWEIEGQ